jgi:L-lysine exporter family protein LysE/ArgO
VAVAFAKGLALGFALITPIGAQNLFVLEQGLRRGLRRALPAVLAAAVCDTVLIAAGAGGASALLAGSRGLRDVLVGVGVAFLVVLGLRSLLVRPEPVDVRSGGSVLVRTLGVSLLNPHAVLDTVGVIGGAVAAQAAAHRLPFAAGAAAASWVWFLLLAAAAAVLQARLSPRGRLWIARGSGLLMLAFAVVLAREILPL